MSRGREIERERGKRHTEVPLVWLAVWFLRRRGLPKSQMSQKITSRTLTTFLSLLRVAAADLQRVPPSGPWQLPSHSATHHICVEHRSMGRLRVSTARSAGDSKMPKLEFRGFSLDVRDGISHCRLISPIRHASRSGPHEIVHSLMRLRLFS